MKAPADSGLAAAAGRECRLTGSDSALGLGVSGPLAVTGTVARAGAGPRARVGPRSDRDRAAAGRIMMPRQPTEKGIGVRRRCDFSAWRNSDKEPPRPLRPVLP